MSDTVTENISQQTQPETQPQPQQQTQESTKDNNMRLLRERAERAEQRALEYERYLQEQQQKQQQTHSEDDFDLNDESYAEGKHLKKIYNRLKKENSEIKNELKNLQEKNNYNSAESRLKYEKPDIEKIVTPDNLKELANSRPDIYRSIMYNPDLYERGNLMYEMINDHVLKKNKYQDVDKKIEENKAKPRSAGTIPHQTGTESPLTRVGDYDRRTLSEERREQLRRQVAAAKQYY